MTAENKTQAEVTDPELSDGNGAVSEQAQPKQQQQLQHVDNKLFKDYYIMQGIVSVEELDAFIQHIKKPLPLTFRITGDNSNVKDMLRIIKQQFIEKTHIPLVSLPWYSDEMAWQLNTETLSIDQIKAIDGFNQFIHQEAACGNVSKQDALNLIPALLLDVKPEHKVLDMRTGSRTVVSQVIDLLVHDGKQKDLDGFVLASETDYKQCRRLSDQIPQLTSPNFAIVNLNDLMLQDMCLPAGDDKTEVFRYDRIICHLPSSGDGMFRNNLEGLRSWSAYMPFSHHGPLCQALYTGLSQLAVGGRLVFFTDSINPVENEAVLYTVITQQRGSVALVDISAEMPKIQYEKGLTSWKVMTKGPRWFREHTEVPAMLRDQLWETMFPPPTKEEAEQFHLDRSVRILPHRQDTAGLFIAVLTRTETLEQCLKREHEQYQAWLKAEEEKAAAAKAAAKKAAEERAAARKAAAEKAAAEKAAKKAADEKAADEKAAAEKAAAERPEGDGATVEDAAIDDKPSEENPDKETESAEDTSVTEKAEGIPESQNMEVENAAENKSSDNQANQKKVSKIEESSSSQKEDRMDVNEEHNSTESKIESVTAPMDVADNDAAKDSGKAPEADSQQQSSSVSVTVPEPPPVDFTYQYHSMGHAAQSNELSKEDALVFFTETDPIWLRIQEFYNLSKSFPLTQLAVRSRDNSCIYYLSSSLKSLTLANQKNISFVHAGVKVFCRVSIKDSACNYRLTQEGLPVMYPHLQRRVLLLPRSDFTVMLSSHTTEISSMTKDTQKKLKALDSGNMVLVCKLDNSRKGPLSQLMISCWKDDSGCRSFLPAYQRQHCLLACSASDFTSPEELSPAEEARIAITALVQALAEPAVEHEEIKDQEMS